MHNRRRWPATTSHASRHFVPINGRVVCSSRGSTADDRLLWPTSRSITTESSTYLVRLPCAARTVQHARRGEFCALQPRLDIWVVDGWRREMTLLNLLKRRPLGIGAHLQSARLWRRLLSRLQPGRLLQLTNRDTRRFFRRISLVMRRFSPKAHLGE